MTRNCPPLKDGAMSKRKKRKRGGGPFDQINKRERPWVGKDYEVPNPKGEASESMPGTQARIEAYRRRLELDEPIWNEDDKSTYEGCDQDLSLSDRTVSNRPTPSKDTIRHYRFDGRKWSLE